MSNVSKSSEVLNHAGDVLVEEVLLLSYTGFRMNITKLVANFTIHEDIYSNGLSGNIVIMDSLNLIENFPIVGQERVMISFRTPGVDKTTRKVELDVYKISSQLRGEEGKVVTVIRLELVSPIMTVSNYFRMNRVLKGTHEDMVTVLFNEMRKYIDYDNRRYGDGAALNKSPSFLIDPTDKTKTALILTNWSPLYALNWITYRATASENSLMSDYLFYQTLDQYNFRSLSKLKMENATREYINIPGGFRNKDTGERDLELEMKSISRYNIVNTHDRMKEMQMDMFSGNQLVCQLTNKTYYKNIHSYTKLFDSNPAKLNKNPLLNHDSPLSNYKTSFIKYHMKPSFTWDGIHDTSFVDRAMSRACLLNQMNSFVMSITVFGDTTVRVGEVVKIKFMSTEDVSEGGDETDRYITGKYLIVSITHEYTAGLHTMILTIAKDSLGEEIPDKKERELSVL